MSSKFDAYEIISVIAPGSVFIFGIVLLFPDLQQFFFEQGFSVGDFGLFLVLSFVAGHLIQAAGNLIEPVIWKPFGGMPTNWISNHPERLLHESQVQRLHQAVKDDFNCDIQNIPSDQSASITREIYAAIQAEGNTSRIDSFNRTYGLMRGVTAGLLLLAFTSLIIYWPAWQPFALLTIASLIGAYRMIRFGRHYGRELFVAYLRRKIEDNS